MVGGGGYYLTRQLFLVLLISVAATVAGGSSVLPGIDANVLMQIDCQYPYFSVWSLGSVQWEFLYLHIRHL